MKLHKLTLPDGKTVRVFAASTAQARFKCRSKHGAIPIKYDVSTAHWWLISFVCCWGWLFYFFG